MLTNRRVEFIVLANLRPYISNFSKTSKFQTFWKLWKFKKISTVSTSVWWEKIISHCDRSEWWLYYIINMILQSQFWRQIFQRWHLVRLTNRRMGLIVLANWKPQIYTESIGERTKITIWKPLKISTVSTCPDEKPISHRVQSKQWLC